MGYSERVCQYAEEFRSQDCNERKEVIADVSLGFVAYRSTLHVSARLVSGLKPNITIQQADHHASDEPFEAAWNGSGLGNGVVEKDVSSCEADGCININRTLPRHVYNDGSVHEPQEIWEHIAGPACTSDRGYSGQRVSVEEMEECTNVICLMSKFDDWSPEPGDEPFELAAYSSWLTGISTGPPEEFDVECLSPPRHGISDTMINNCNDTGEECGTPIHPWCFEMFKRMSIAHFGHVDIDGLRQLWRENDEYCCRFPGFPDTLDVLTVSEQFYAAAPGTEYMVSHPIRIPALQTLIQSCQFKEGANGEVVFSTGAMIKGTSDPFARLSSELRNMIMLLLQRGDVASLRLVSRSFQQLPQSYFRRLVVSEMPWVWEIEDLPPMRIDWYLLWCRLSAADGGPQKDANHRYWLKYASYPGTYWDWLLAGLTEDEKERFGVRSLKASERTPPEEQENRMKAVAKERMECGKHLPSHTEIKGLRNRRRIYKDVEEVLHRIGELDA